MNINSLTLPANGNHNISARPDPKQQAVNLCRILQGASERPWFMLFEEKAISEIKNFLSDENYKSLFFKEFVSEIHQRGDFALKDWLREEMVAIFDQFYDWCLEKPQEYNRNDVFIPRLIAYRIYRSSQNISQNDNSLANLVVKLKLETAKNFYYSINSHHQNFLQPESFEKIKGFFSAYVYRLERFITSLNSVENLPEDEFYFYHPQTNLNLCFSSLLPNFQKELLESSCFDQFFTVQQTDDNFKPTRNPSLDFVVFSLLESYSYEKLHQEIKTEGKTIGKILLIYAMSTDINLSQKSKVLILKIILDQGSNLPKYLSDINSSRILTILKFEQGLPDGFFYTHNRQIHTTFSSQEGWERRLLLEVLAGKTFCFAQWSPQLTFYSFESSAQFKSCDPYVLEYMVKILIKGLVDYDASRGKDFTLALNATFRNIIKYYYTINKFNQLAQELLTVTLQNLLQKRVPGFQRIEDWLTSSVESTNSRKRKREQNEKNAPSPKRKAIEVNKSVSMQILKATLESRVNQTGGSINKPVDLTNDVPIPSKIGSTTKTLISSQSSHHHSRIPPNPLQNSAIGVSTQVKKTAIEDRKSSATIQFSEGAMEFYAQALMRLTQVEQNSEKTTPKK